MASPPEFPVLSWRHLAAVALALAFTVLGTPSVNAQAPFPPLAAAQATTAQAALAALSVPQAEASSYVMLDIPEVAAPGQIKGKIGSEYPGTSMLVLLRTGPPEFAPAAPAAPGASGPKPKVHPKPDPKRAGTVPSAQLPSPVPSLIVARKIAPGEPAVVNVEFDITRTQRYAVYAFAQGRWFVAEREVKVGQSGSHR